MSESTATSCVLIPCSETERWAVPQACLAEIQVVNSTSEDPPPAISWRGREVPVLDRGEGGEVPWAERRIGTGLVAIFLGREESECEYWGVAIRGQGLTVASLVPADINDASSEAADDASSAFIYNDVLYQVPDLDGLQKHIAANLAAA
ncbi:MAG: hypothetical protein R3228_00210 [Halioglobus sp.]|nr:hypothetical protein [Halioglobus sp.]